MSRLGAALGWLGQLRLFGYRGRDQEVAGSPIAPSGMSVGDLADEALAGLFARPGRMSLTVLGTVIGLAALVATLGLSRTAGNRIVGHFDALAATEIVVSRSATASPEASALPWDAPARIERLNGVVAAGNMSKVNIGNSQVSTSPISDPTRQTTFQLAVQATSPGLFEAVRATMRNGRFLDEGNSIRGDRVAVLGPNAAEKLGITGVEQLPAIRIGDQIYAVVGIIDTVARQPGLLGAVIIPEGTARNDFRLTSPEIVVVETRIGAAKLVSQQLPTALRPDSPRGLKVAKPPEPQRARDRVQSDLSLLFLMLGGVSLLVGAIGIANVTLVSVIERTGEIGLRRALGATRRHIALQFLLESATMGLVGGVIGACVGTLVVVGVAAYQDWTPVLDPLVPFVTPLLGGLVGLVAGAYPAMRAARLEPVEALRSGN
jgi:macrolide transport system ATP-binding/permease protein